MQWRELNERALSNGILERGRVETPRGEKLERKKNEQTKIRNSRLKKTEPPESTKMGRGDRPELTAPPEVFYNDEEARKYTTNSRMIEIQVRRRKRKERKRAFDCDGFRSFF